MAIQVDEDYEVRNWTPSSTTLVTVLAATLLVAAGRNEDYVRPATTPAIASHDEWVAPVVAGFVPTWNPASALALLGFSSGNEDYAYPLTTPAVAATDEQVAPVVAPFPVPWNLTAIVQLQLGLGRNEDYAYPLATPAVLGEAEWTPPRSTVGSWLAAPFLEADGTPLPQTATLVFEDDSWGVPILWPQAQPSQPASSDADYVYPAATPASLGEAEWPLGVMQQRWQWALFADDSDVPTLFGVPSDETGWSAPAPWPVAGAPQVAWQAGDEIVPHVDEDYWLVLPAPPALRLVAPWTTDDNFAAPVAPSVVDDDPGYTPRPWPAWWLFSGSQVLSGAGEFVAPSGIVPGQMDCSVRVRPAVRETPKAVAWDLALKFRARSPLRDRPAVLSRVSALASVTPREGVDQTVVGLREFAFVFRTRPTVRERSAVVPRVAEHPNTTAAVHGTPLVT